MLCDNAVDDCDNVREAFQLCTDGDADASISPDELREMLEAHTGPLQPGELEVSRHCNLHQ